MEAPLHREVGQAVLVLRDDGLVGAGEKVHEQEDQQVDRFLVDVLQLEAEDGEVLEVEVIAECPALTRGLEAGPGDSLT